MRERLLTAMTKNSSIKVWKRLCAGFLSILVVFGVFSQLAMTGVTLEGEHKDEPVRVLECDEPYHEHTHEDGCYTYGSDCIEKTEQAETPESTPEPSVEPTAEPTPTPTPEVTESPVITDPDNDEGEVVETDGGQAPPIVPDSPAGEQITQSEPVASEPEAVSLMGDTEHTCGINCGSTLTCTLHVHDDSCYGEQQQDDNLLGSDNDNYSSELEDFLDKFVMTDGEGNVIGNGGSVVSGEEYLIKMEFAEGIFGGKQFKYDEEGYLTYQFDSSVKVPVEQDQEIKDETTGAVIGHYSIDENGLVKLKYNDGYIDEFENVVFKLEVNVTFKAGETDKTIEFGDGVTIVVKPEEETKTELQVKKTCGEYSDITSSIDYTVEIKAVGGPVSNIVMTDRIELGVNDSTTGVKYELASNIVVTASEPNVYSKEFTSEEAGFISSNDPEKGNKPYASFNLTIKDLTLEAGEIATVKYSIKFPEETFEIRYGKDKYSLDGRFYNSVNVEGKDSDEELVYGSAIAESKYFKDILINKGGWDSDIDGKPLIKWLVTAGNGHHPVGGKTITDKLEGSQKYYVEGSSFKVFFWTTDGGAYRGDSRKDEEGWDCTRISVYEDKSGFVYTVPDTINRKVNGVDTDLKVAKVQLEFYTDYDVNANGGSTTFKNNAFTEDSGDKGVDASVDVGIGKNSISKSHEIVGDYIEYEIDIEVSKNMYDKNYFIHDELVIFRGTEPIHVYNDPIEPSLELRDDQGKLVNIEGQYKFVWGPELSNNSDIDAVHYAPNRFFVIFSKDTNVLEKGNLKQSKWLLDGNYTMKIKYKISLDAPIDSAVSKDLKLRDLLFNEYGYLNGDNLRNTAKYRQYGGNNPIYGEIHDYIYIGTGKAGWKLDDKDIPETMPGTYYQYGVEFRFSDLPIDAPPTFTDTFDGRLEYVEGSIFVRKKPLNGVGEDYGPPPDKVTLSGEKNNTISFDFKDIDGPGDDFWTDTKAVYQVFYVLKVREDADFPPGVTPLLNRATVTVTKDNHEYNFNSSTVLEHGDNPVDKKMIVAEGGASASVTIEINPDAEKLAVLEDGEHGDDILTIVDTMSDNLALSNPTLMVEAKINGEWVVQKLYNENEREKYRYFIVGNTVTFYLPDETPLRITYKVDVLGNLGQEVEISNTVSVSGTYTAKAGDTFTINDSFGSGSASRGQIMLYKTDGVSGDRLDGAVFALYGPDYTSRDNDTKDRPANVPDDVVIGGVKLFYYQVQTTENGGEALFDNQSIFPINSKHNNHYAFVEITAPDGYQPIPLEDSVLFYIGHADDNCVIIEGAKQAFESITIENDPWGIALPETGGTGLLPYLVPGFSLTVVSGGALIGGRRKRRNTNTIDTPDEE